MSRSSDLPPISQDEQLSIGRKRPASDNVGSKKLNLPPELAQSIQEARERNQSILMALPHAVANANLSFMLKLHLKTWENIFRAAELQKTREDLQASKLMLPFGEGDLLPTTAGIFVDLCKASDAALDAFLKVFENLRNARPSPSVYARNWAEPQARFKNLLCMRPTERTGLPLATLHDVFRNYHQQMARSLPLNDTGTAFRVASLLCSTMGESFATVKDRSDAFNDCVSELFSDWDPQITVQASSESSYGRIDFTFHIYAEKRAEFPYILREGKLEPGDAGDAYVQASRDYQLCISSLKERKHKSAKKFLLAGAPMFLVCVVGPTLCVAGAFFDGTACIVEPLGPSCWMVKDITGGRPRALAQVLYALDQGLQELYHLQEGLDWIIPKPYPSGIPRVYNSFTTLTETVPSGPFIPSNPQPLFLSYPHPCFSTRLTLTDGKAPSVLVKMVNGGYGQNVHKLLAKNGYAPTLYGICKEDGIPSLYVMELLAEEDWITLFDFGKPGTGCEAYMDAIQCTSNTIMDLLEVNEFVHGDLRANNIMIRVKDGKPTYRTDSHVDLKVVDFDWAGKAGEVCYPANRNRGIQWPARAGEAIELGHDRQVVDIWWGSFGKPTKANEMKVD